MDPAQGLSRALSRQTAEERFEEFGEDLQVAMREGFLALAKEFEQRFKVVNGSRDKAAIAAEIHHLVDLRLQT